jgi:small lipoprotein (TIGR04452 family)
MSVSVFRPMSVSTFHSQAYYLKSDVNKCVSDIKGFKGFVIGSTLTVLTSCKLDKPDGILLGDPLPKL